MLTDLLVKALVLAVISYEDELDTTFLPFPSRAVYECSTPYIVGVADVHSASRVKLGGFFAGAPFLPLLGALCLKRTLLLVKSSSKGFHQRIEHSVVAELDIPKLFSAFAAFIEEQ